MKKYVDNERGSGVILTIFSFAIVGIMLILVLNIAMVFTKKEQTSLAAEQASFAATSVVYEQIDPVVQTHYKEVVVGKDEDGNDIIEKEYLRHKVEDRKKSLLMTKPSLSNSEAYIEAVNSVLLSEIPTDSELLTKISSSINTAKLLINSVIQNFIDQNVGEETYFEYEWELDDEYRIEVIARTKFNAVDYNGIDFGGESEIPQRGKGPVISFIEASGW